MKFRGLVMAAVAALGFGAGAQAGTVTFSFTAASNGAWVPSLNYSSGGVDLTVTAKTTNGWDALVRTWAGHGLGVCNKNEQPWCRTGDHQVDSFGLDEVVYLAFSKTVSLTSLVLNYVDRADTFDLIVDGTPVLSDEALPDSWTATYNFAAPPTGVVFGVGAGSTTLSFCADWRKGKCIKWKCYTQDSAFKIASVTVEFPDPPPPPPPVPLPASALLLAGGLGLLGALRRRRG